MMHGALENITQAVGNTPIVLLHKVTGGLPVEIYVKNSDWRRDPNGRVDVESLRKLSALMLDKLKWLDKPVNVDEMVEQSFLPR